MPMQRCTLKNGKQGWKYGKSGKCHSTRAAAERQKRAMYASGYKSRTRKSG